MTATCAHIVEFSTDFLPEADRIAYWREHYGHVMLRVDLEPARDVAFHACMTSLSLPGLQLIEGLVVAGKNLAHRSLSCGRQLERSLCSAINSERGIASYPGRAAAKQTHEGWKPSCSWGMSSTSFLPDSVSGYPYTPRVPRGRCSGLFFVRGHRLMARDAFDPSQPRRARGLLSRTPAGCSGLAATLEPDCCQSLGAACPGSYWRSRSAQLDDFKESGAGRAACGRLA